MHFIDFKNFLHQDKKIIMTESTTKSSKTQELINQGKDLINKGKFDEASSLYQSFLTFNEKNVEVLYELVKTYFYLEKPGELIDSAKKILKINRNHDKTYYLMARAYYIFLNNYHEASIRILKAIEINSNDSYYYSLASQIFYCMNNLKRASKLAQDSLNIDEKNFEALLTQAMIEQQNKNNEKAEELFRQALLYGPEGPSFYFNINHLHLKLASTKAGYKLLKEAISLYPDNEVYL
jgi:tetratricopeptide (TPR) repeat protein